MINGWLSLMKEGEIGDEEVKQLKRVLYVFKNIKLDGDYTLGEYFLKHMFRRGITNLDIISLIPPNLEKKLRLSKILGIKQPLNNPTEIKNNLLILTKETSKSIEYYSPIFKFLFNQSMLKIDIPEITGFANPKRKYSYKESNGIILSINWDTYGIKNVMSEKKYKYYRNYVSFLCYLFFNMYHGKNDKNLGNLGNSTNSTNSSNLTNSQNATN